jgi:hypothetical protein
MTASVQTLLRAPTRPSASLRSAPVEALEAATPQWPVDAQALARCRALLSGHAAPREAFAPGVGDTRWIDVPPAYAAFCRSHLASVRRLRPELAWDDARPAYALALAAHAVLCEALDDEREEVLAAHWDSLRGESRLDWTRARPLLADGCRALERLDPLAMHR